jgi:crotonobetainyl-CoA:carnitine CoA-transferase CaiB-like acyl-CoA transferase
MNTTRPQGRELFKRLVKISDVVIDNLSFGIMARWGFDYQSLKQVKKDIIVASMPSMGKGLHEQWTTWGMNLLSYTGFAQAWGHADTPMEDRAANSTYGDYQAGMFAVSGILAALYHRSKTGEGQYIEVCQAESTAGLLATSYLDYFVNGHIPPPAGNRNPKFAPYNSYRCKGDDAWCVIAVFNESDWQRFCIGLDSPHWTEDAKFQNMEARLKNVLELDHNVESWTKQRTPHQVMNILQSYGVASGAVQNAEDLFYDPQLRNTGYMVEAEIAQRGKIIFEGSAIQLEKGQKTETRRAPILGEHNDYVYRQLLGLTADEIEQLTESQVIY